MKTLGVLKEKAELESRVAMVPEVVSSIIKARLADVLVEKGAGAKAGFFDADYEKAGAKIVNSFDELARMSDILIAIDAAKIEPTKLKPQQIVLGLFDPFNNISLLKSFNNLGITALALELVPRISRAQSMDVLSSQANIAGYMAVLMAAAKLNKIMPMLMTAAGTIVPAKVLIMGAGVAGLQAIATAKRLGAVVFAYDVRPAVKEQVESLGAKFVEIKINESGEGSGGYAKTLSEQSQEEIRYKLSLFAKDMDILITTAQIPGKKAPQLLNKEIFSLMKNDAIIIDMAVASGGNVPGSLSNEWRRMDNVWLYGADNLSRLAPKDASFTFGKNILALLELLFDKNTAKLNMEDEIVKNAVICHENSWINQSIAQG